MQRNQLDGYDARSMRKYLIHESSAGFSSPEEAIQAVRTLQDAKHMRLIGQVLTELVVTSQDWWFCYGGEWLVLFATARGVAWRIESGPPPDIAVSASSLAPLDFVMVGSHGSSRVSWDRSAIATLHTGHKLMKLHESGDIVFMDTGGNWPKTSLMFSVLVDSESQSFVLYCSEAKD